MCLSLYLVGCKLLRNTIVLPEYISQFDKHIAYNKKQKRPYIGIVLDISNILYFAPMFLPKHEQYKENLTFFKMYGNKDRTDYLGIIRFSDMIPVPKSEISIFSSKNFASRAFSSSLNKTMQAAGSLLKEG